MKLKFKNQEFQIEAVKSVTDLFIGQERTNTTFSIVNNAAEKNLLQNDFGFGNNLLLDEKTLADNLHAVQKRHSLPLTDETELPLHVSVEMETGTGKTYVYIKTILELNKLYGFSKFVIVVPSVAIREGVYKSFEVTKEHFATAYDGVPYWYFIYNSSKLSDVRRFANSSNIGIMIINIDAFKKAENVIKQPQDKLNGETAMRYIQDTHPVVIIDEPQSVNNTPKAKEAISALNPLCVLRYSATHREKINLLYKLDPVKAYQLGLVKQICVSSGKIINDSNRPYVALKSVSHENGFSAKIELDIEKKDGKVERTSLTVRPDDDLYLKSNRRELYAGYKISGIDCTPGFEHIEFSNTEIVRLGESIGSIDEMVLKRSQIYQTIEAHFQKELRYFQKGIKVLSLFFIDEVKKYRTEDGQKGIYAKMFEECYNELIEKPIYSCLKTLFNTNVELAHDGYFSQDKKGVYKNTKGDTAADDDTYALIMKDKEKLLSFECPLRFIFSHSALKEGWDNPNVFQVCTLIDQRSVFTCRQKIGRGLRLCVNQDGERVEDKDINLLHVIANENFTDFANKLQKEIEEETGMKFGVLERSMLIGLECDEEKEVERQTTTAQAEQIVESLKRSGVIDEAGSVRQDVVPAEIAFPENVPEPLKKEVEKIVIEDKTPITVKTLASKTYTETIIEKKQISYERADQLMAILKDKKVLSKDGKIKDTMKEQFIAGNLDTEGRMSAAEQRAVAQALTRATTRVPVRDASREVVVHLKKQIIVSPEFMELWNKIKAKTTYRVRFDIDELIAKSVKDLAALPPVSTARLLTQTADIDIQQSGVSHIERSTRTIDLTNTYDSLPDILRLISTKTLLKCSTVAEIIKQSGKWADFLKNPQEFYEKTLEIIKRNRHQLAIDGIKYIRLAGEEFFVQEVFNSSELIANLDKNAVPVSNSVYDYIIYDSSTESQIAQQLDNDPDVKMFFKLPPRFQIQTPIGPYNPDWAVYFEKNGEQKLYFVLESKGTEDLFNLRTPEALKIHCGAEHFKALDVDFPLKPIKNWVDFKKTV